MLYIFDMGGVVTTTAKIEERICQILGISMDQYRIFTGQKPDDSGKSKDDLVLAANNGEISAREFWIEFSKRSGINVTTDWFKNLFHPVLNQETVEIIHELKVKGHRVICGTNTTDPYYHTHLERGDYSYFDQTYPSNYLGVSKPDTDFWKIIMMSEEVKPEDCVFIDDKSENVKAAENLGIRSFVFTSARQLRKDLGL